MERMSKPKFIKEIEKFEGKERAECGRWYIRVYGELDHKPMVELESLEIVVKELHKLEEENKNLKKEKGKIRQRLVALEKKLETLSRVKENKELREENKKLNEKIRFLEQCLDNKEKVNKKLREELSAYDREYFDEDKKAKNIFIDKSGKVIKGGEFTTLC